MKISLEEFREKIVSYFKIDVNQIEINDQRREVIEKTVLLPRETFNVLVIDMWEEIVRREQGKPPEPYNPEFPDSRNESREKLAGLKHETLENLAIDIYFVYHHRTNPHSKMSVHEIELLISDLENVIVNIKGDMEYENLILEQLNNATDLKGKNHIYHRYLKRIFEKHKEDIRVITYMDKIYKERFDVGDDQIHNFVEPIRFLKMADPFFEKMPKYINEYEFHKSNLISIIQGSEYKDRVKHNIIINELIAIYMMLYKTTIERNNNIDSTIEVEICQIINSLEQVKKSLAEEKEGRELILIGESVMNASATLNSKLKSYYKIDNNLIKKLEKDIKVLNDCVSKNENGLIPSAVYNIAFNVKNILNLISADNIL